MKENKDKKWLDEIISKATDLGKVEFDAQKWKREYFPEESEEAQSSCIKVESCKNIWRCIMKSKITRYSAVASIPLIIMLFLMNPFTGPNGSAGVALADVYNNVENLHTFVLKGTRVFTKLNEPNDIFQYDFLKDLSRSCSETEIYTFDVIKYLSMDYGYMEEQYCGDQLISRVHVIPSERLAVGIMPQWKKYIKYYLTDEQMDLFNKLNIKGFVNVILEADYEELPATQLNGVKVCGFQSQDVTFWTDVPKILLDVNEVTLRLWVSAEDCMPVQLEGHLLLDRCLFTCFNRVYLDEVDTFIDVNVELDPNLFEPNIPADYTPLIPRMSTKTKAGLLSVGALPIGLIFLKRLKKQRSRKKTN